MANFSNMIQSVSGSDATLKWLEPFSKSCPLTFAQFVKKSFHRCAASPSFQRPGDPGGMLRDGDGPILEFHGDGEKLGSDTIPLVICYVAIENGPVEIVDFPINSMVDLSSSLCKRLPEAIPF